jgi:hypothetical protein
MVRSILWRCFGLRSTSWYNERESLTDPKNGAIENLVGAEELPKVKETWPQFFKYNNIAAIKTHEPEDPGGKTIYVVRDGRAAIVSYYHWLRDGCGTPATLEAIIRGEAGPGSWSEHLAAWEPKTRPDTLLLRYEDLCCLLEPFIGLIAAFIDKPAISYELAPWKRFHDALPTFFRSGCTDEWREVLTGNDLDLFWELHGRMMNEYGYARHTADSREVAAV